MNNPADTINYMLAGYAVIFGVMAVYIISLVVRWRRLMREQGALQDLADEQPGSHGQE